MVFQSVAEIRNFWPQLVKTDIEKKRYWEIFKWKPRCLMYFIFYNQRTTHKVLLKIEWKFFTHSVNVFACDSLMRIVKQDFLIAKCCVYHFESTTRRALIWTK